MLPTDVPLPNLGPSVLLLLQLLLPPTSAFFPNIWSLLAAPGSITHQDLTEDAALNVTLQLFLEQPPLSRPRLRLEDFLVSIPGSCHIPVGFPHPLGPLHLEGSACQEKVTTLFLQSLPSAATTPKSPGPEIRSPPSLGRSKITPQFFPHPALSASC